MKVTEIADRKISVSWIDNSNNENEFSIRFVGKRTGFSDHTGSKSVARNTISTPLTGLRSNHQDYVCMCWECWDDQLTEESDSMYDELM